MAEDSTGCCPSHYPCQKKAVRLAGHGVGAPKSGASLVRGLAHQCVVARELGPDGSCVPAAS